MKKFFIAALVALVGFSVFAQDGANLILDFGVGFPQTKGKVGSNDAEFKASGVAFDFQVVGFKNRFAWLVDMQLGGAGTEDIATDKQRGFAMSFDGGVGGALVNNGRVSLVLAAVLGLDMMVYDYSDKSSGITVSMTPLIMTFDFGADVYFNIRLGDRIGLYADMKFLCGLGSVINTYSYSYTVYGTRYSGSGSDSESLKAFLFKPSVGLSIAF